MSNEHPVKRIVVGVDGSPQSASALEWAIALARPLEAEVVAVYALPTMSYLAYGNGFAPPVLPAELDPRWRAEMKAEFARWCEPLAAAGVRNRMLMEDGRPASVIAEVADRENADLVVVGRRGHGGFAELLLGSVSHELSHHCRRPVLLISERPQLPARRDSAGVSATA